MAYEIIVRYPRYYHPVEWAKKQASFAPHNRKQPPNLHPFSWKVQTKTYKSLETARMVADKYLRGRSGGPEIQTREVMIRPAGFYQWATK